MSFSMRNALVLSVGVVMGASLAVGQSVFADKAASGSSPLPLEELRTFSDVFGKIKSDYVGGTEDKELLNNAIKGMLSGLDPHSSYLEPDAYTDLKESTTGEFGGLGIEVGMAEGFVKIISPIDDTPAKRAGIMAGDIILRIDDTPIKNVALNDAVKLMRGKPGSKILLTIMREGRETPLKIEIIRDIIKVASVKGKMLESGFGYVRITQFQSKTGEDLVKFISKLKKENEGSLKGLILDLRNNPGGVLGAAVSVSDAFLESGLVVYTQGRSDDSRHDFTATPTDVLKGAPLVVLVNGGSASASEIVAGALQDHKRAIIMGTKTFGKGSVQTILPMDNGAALKLTTARYFTPDGRSIQAEGIEPDIPLERITVTAAAPVVFERVKEVNLSGHLENDSSSGDTEKSDEEVEESLAKKDYQLYEALNLLKGLHILQSS